MHQQEGNHRQKEVKEAANTTLPGKGRENHMALCNLRLGSDTHH